MVNNHLIAKPNRKAENLTVVFVESASDWLDVPFDWPPKQGKRQNQYRAGTDIQTLAAACNGKTNEKK